MSGRPSRAVEHVDVLAADIAEGMRVARRGYVRDVLDVHLNVDGDVLVTVDRGFGETVTETYGPNELVECVVDRVEAVIGDATEIAVETLLEQAEPIVESWRFPLLARAETFGTLVVAEPDQLVAAVAALKMLRSGAAFWKR